MFIRASRLQNGMTIQGWDDHMYTDDPIVYSNIFNVYFDEYEKGSGTYISFDFLYKNFVRTRHFDAHNVMLLMDIIDDWMPVINAKNLRVGDLVAYSNGFEVQYGTVTSNTEHGAIGLLKIGDNQLILYRVDGNWAASAAFRPNNRAAYDKWVEIITRPILDQE